MSVADLAPLAVGSQMSVCPDAAVWTRSGGGPNLIVLTDDRLIVAKLPRKRLKTAKLRLQNGDPVAHVVGEHSTCVYLGSIRKISTIKSGSDLCVEYENARARCGTLRVRLPDDAARDALLHEARRRIPAPVDVVEKVGHRLAGALGPINCLFVCGLMAWGGQWFFSSGFADMKITLPKRTPRTAPGAARSRPAPADAAELAEKATFKRPEDSSSQSGDYHENRSKAAKMARGMARHKRAGGAVLLLLAIVAAIGCGVSWLGYQWTMSLIIALTGLSVFWLLARVLHPPRTTVLINTQKVRSIAW